MATLSTPTRPTSRSSDSRGSSSSSSSRVCSKDFCNILSKVLNQVSNVSLREGQHHQEHQQNYQVQHQYWASPSPLSIDSSLSSGCAIETPVKQKAECVRTIWTPPPILAKTERNESSSSQASIVIPFDISTSDIRITNITKTNKKFLCRKRQRASFNRNVALPPMLPGSPEFDDTTDNNPWGRHVAIHSPLTGIRNTLNLGFVSKLGSSKSSHKSQIQRVLMPPPRLTKGSGHTRSSSSTLSSSSDEEIDRMQTFFPSLDDPYEDNDANVDEGEHDIVIATRALKMRRRCRKDNPYNTFDLAAFAIWLMLNLLTYWPLRIILTLL